MSDKKKQEKTFRVTVDTLTEILTGFSSWRDEAPKLKRLGLETGPDAEDRLMAVREALSALAQDEGALDALMPDLPGAFSAAVIEVLVKRSDLSTLARIQTHIKDRDAQKALGAGLHRLQLQGLRLPTPTAQARSAKKRTPPEVAVSWRQQALGYYLNFYLRDSREGEQLYTFIIHEQRGALKLHHETERASRIIEDLRTQCVDSQGAFYKSSPEHGLFLLQEALELSRRHLIQLPFEAYYLPQILKDDYGVTPAQELPPGMEELTPLLSGSPEEFLPLLTSRAVMILSLNAEDLHPVMNRISALLDSIVVLGPESTEERTQSALDEEIDRWFTGDSRRLWIRRMEELALGAHHRGEEEVAQQAWRTRLALLDESLPASRCGFLNFWFRMQISAYVEEMQQGQGDAAHVHGPDCDHDHAGHDHAHTHSHSHGHGHGHEQPEPRLIVPSQGQPQESRQPILLSASGQPISSADDARPRILF